MKLFPAASVASLLLLSVAAQAQSGLTRAQVKAELAEAIRTGDILASGESGRRLNELYLERYPAVRRAAPRTREDVKSELAEAVRTGDIIGPGEAHQKLNEMYPNRYPSIAKAPGATREQVREELAIAIRNGEIPSGELSLTDRQRSPASYAAGNLTRASVREGSN